MQLLLRFVAGTALFVGGIAVGYQLNSAGSADTPPSRIVRSREFVRDDARKPNRQAEGREAALVAIYRRPANMDPMKPGYMDAIRNKHLAAQELGRLNKYTLIIEQEAEERAAASEQAEKLDALIANVTSGSRTQKD